MNASSFDRILRQVVVVPLLALLLLAGALTWLVYSANATVALIELSDERITQTDLLDRLFIDAETGLRGYQTTHDPAFLEPFYRAEQTIPVEFTKRYSQATNDARRSAVLNLQTHYNTWQQGFAEPLIATIAAGGQANDVALNLQGKQMMDGLRAQTAALNATTEHRRDDYIRQYRKQIHTLILVLVLAAILLGIVLGIYLRRLLQDVSAAFRQSHNALRIRAEEAFRSEQKLRTTLQSIGDAVITCDTEGRVSTMNSVAEDLTRWAETDARNHPLEEVFAIVDETTLQPLENPVEKVKRLNRVVGLANHTILNRRDGTSIFIDDSAAPIRDKTGRQIGVVLVFRDITMAKKQREALLANEKLAVAGRLAATIAHEIHNPLDSVSNLLFLMDGQSTPEEHAHFLDLARQEINRVTQISRAMLSLYRESRAPVEVELKSMLESILLLMERRFAMLGVTVGTDLPEGLIIHGFPAELRQVFTNLLTNAAEAAGSGQSILVRATPCPARTLPDGTRREAGVLVAVQDTGPGVPEEVKTSLFQPFFTTKGERGTGLGLWVSRGIITRHGGSLDLHSSTAPEDHGTTAEVFLATDPVIHPAGD